ncbi:uncharacterized protein LOC110989938 [Acanthaster planci]|uniref:Uncharacterized protein LOC110989938 n=1 Tax=Acanthaster planci TaxID=133434 RepID=A0A8B8A029_ACAPL|nr:uncharacterized protein LOC110989938 [Acanthaster planci]
MRKPLVIGILLASCMAGLCCRQTIGRHPYLPPSAVPPLCRDEGILAYDGAPPSPFLVELEFIIEYLQDLIDSGCSDSLSRFLCTIHYQRLDRVRLGVDGEGVYQKPCAKLCRAIWRDCRVTARQLGLDRTPELNCKKHSRLENKKECLSDLFPPNEPPNWITAVTRDSMNKASVHFLSPTSTTQAIRIRLNETFSPIEREIFHSVDPKGPPERTIEIFHLWNAGSYRIEITALNDFGEGTVTIANIPPYNSNVSGDGGTVPDENYWRCEDITVEMCQSDIGYTQTSMPNFLHHPNQDDAKLEVHKFYTFVDAQCSPFLRTFLCAMYTPECTYGTSRLVVPCRDLCVAARNDCEEYMNYAFGVSWPQYLSCDNFPNFSEGKDCYLGDAPLIIDPCEVITVEICQSDIGYTKTAMPNILGHQTQHEVEIELQQFYPLLQEHECSPFLKKLLCAMHTPQCTGDSSRPILPCRELCVQVMDRCEGLMQEYGLLGPGGHSCELPSFSAGEDCYLGGANMTEIQPAHDRCQDINVSMCQSGIGYNHTVMPSVLGHETQSEAAIQLSSFMPLVEYGCSPHARSYFCSMYLPMCNTSSGAKVLPCRELCDSVRIDCLGAVRECGISGPERFVCENLPSRNSGSTCYLGDLEPTISSDGPGPQQFDMTSTLKPRRNDIHNLGVPSMFRGWVDVQGQGAANDYCRVVTNSNDGYLLSCSLAGMEGSQSDLDYNSTGPWFDAGHVDTWYMMDVNGDRRDDYCRCIGPLPATHVSCLLAGEGGFMTETLDYKPVPGGCHNSTADPFSGLESVWVGDDTGSGDRT